MGSIAPAIQAESEDARKITAGVMSWGSPIRPSGICLSTCFWKSPSTAPTTCVPSVSTKPRLMALTRMLREPNSLESDFVMASTAALVAS